MKERHLTFPDIMNPISNDPLKKPLIIIGAHIRSAIYWAKQIKSNGYSRTTDSLLEDDINAIFYLIRSLEALEIVEKGDSIRIMRVVNHVCSKLMH